MKIEETKIDFDETNLLDDIRSKLVKSFTEDNGPNDETSMLIGRFLYAHIRIERLIEEIIISISPNLTRYLSKRERPMGFQEKIDLLKSLIENPSVIGIFDLLKVINIFRNKIAHREFKDAMVDVDAFSNSFSNSFSIFADEEFKAAIKRVGKAGPITIPVKCAILTAKVLELLLEVEKFGKIHSNSYRQISELQNLTNTKIQTRLMILFLQIQTGLKSAEVREKYSINN